MEEIWILGVGQFGRIAFQRLSAGKKRHRFVLVDPLRENLTRCEGLHCTHQEQDGVAFLMDNLAAGKGPDWIIPALPIHLAAEWLLRRLGVQRVRRGRLPDALDEILPNPMRGLDGNIYVSHADFRCPDDCAEPRDICTVTGKPRKRNMFDILKETNFGTFQSLVLRSHQLGPGIGGYRPRKLFDLLEKVEKAHGSLIVSTACRCHGVLTGLERI
jgi:hypothetical protein